MFFDRIDTSNIADDNYVGMEKVLKDWGPLLNKNNPNSTLITTLMNWHLGKQSKNNL